MYEKNLKEDLRLRLSSEDMNFLRGLAEQRGVSISECIRSIIGEYRRSLETMDVLSKVLDLAKKEELKGIGGKLSNGDTKTDFND